MDPNNPVPSRRPSSIPPSGMPPGMSLDAAELNRANWALGLGIASLMCFCVSAVPALIVGWPVMKRGHNPDARSRAKIGVIFSLVMLGISLLLILFYLAVLIFGIALATSAS